MKWLRNKIIKWLFEEGYTSYLDILKEYDKIRSEVFDIRD